MTSLKVFMKDSMNQIKGEHPPLQDDGVVDDPANWTQE